MIIDPDKRGGAAEGDDDLLGGAYQGGERDLRISVPLETSISSLLPPPREKSQSKGPAVSYSDPVCVEKFQISSLQATKPKAKNK